MSNLQTIHDNIVNAALAADLKIAKRLFNIDDLPDSAVGNTFVLDYPETKFTDATTNLQYSVSETVILRFLVRLKEQDDWYNARVLAEKLVTNIVGNSSCGFCYNPQDISYEPFLGRSLLIVDIKFDVKRRLDS